MDSPSGGTQQKDTTVHGRRDVTWKEQCKRVKVNLKRMESTGLELEKEEVI